MADMWFGNRNYQTWIPCPAVGAPTGRRGSSRSARYLNGGAFHRATKSGSKFYSLTWTKTSRDRIRPITDFAEGVHGDGPFFWSDPFTMDKNVLAQAFATPSLGAYDGVILNGADTRPSVITTPTNSLGYPFQSAVYTMVAGQEPIRHWIPIPPGYTAHVGAHGSVGTGGVVTVRPTTGPSTFGTPVNLTMLAVTNATRFNATFSSSTCNGIEVYLGGVGTITLSGLMVQILPTGTAAATGGFISGQGHTGATFLDHPSIEAYSVALDMVGATAELEETEQWR